MPQEPNGSENNTQNPEVSQTPLDAAQDPQLLEKQIEQLRTELKEKEEKYLYLYADFENYKKRAFKERSDLVKFGWENVARDLLQVADNLERALQHAPPSTDPNLLKGLQMVHSQFISTLERQGVQVIPTEGAAFDPNLHEAVGKESVPNSEGQIVREEMKGYTLHGRLLRPSRVMVGG